MKRILRGLAFFLILIMCGAQLCSCALLFAIREEFQLTEEEVALTVPESVTQAHYVAFLDHELKGVQELDFENVEAFTEEAQMAFGSVSYPQVYYQALSPEEKQVYRLLTHALEHQKSFIYIDDRLLEKCDRSLEEIFTLLSLDCPWLEQNLRYSLFSNKLPVMFQEYIFRFMIPVTILQINSFTPEYAEKKQEAMDAAIAFLSTLPEGLSQREKAAAIYRYLITEVKYSNAATPEEAIYLYDALCKKETNCDGFANAFSLLCNLSGLECFEKRDDVPEGAIGHTWNAVKLDGIWYNVDCSLSEDMVQEELAKGIFTRFLFSDDRLTMTLLYSDLIPPCTENALPADCVLETPQDPELAQRVLDAFAATENSYVLIQLKNGELTDPELQSIADTLQSSIRSSAYTWGTCQYYFVTKE